MAVDGIGGDADADPQRTDGGHVTQLEPGSIFELPEINIVNLKKDVAEIHEDHGPEIFIDGDAGLDAALGQGLAAQGLPGGVPGSQIVQAVAPDAIIAAGEEAPEDGNLLSGLDGLDHPELEASGQDDVGIPQGVVAAGFRHGAQELEIGTEEIRGGLSGPGE